jgi:N-dimethylarginine dimethylaminohydrolase
MALKILMCPPKYYEIDYEINPWMHLGTPIHASIAQKQWEDLYSTIRNIGVDIELMRPVLGLPDLVFTANAALLHGKKAWIANFRYPERQNESIHFKRWFQDAQFEIVNNHDDFTKAPYFEGAGDALFLGNQLIVGYGFRSQKEVYDQPFFQNFDLVLCELINPYFYHLDTCFCPLNDHLAIWYPDAFSQETKLTIEKSCELIAVTEDEAKRFACNAVVIHNHIIIPSSCPNLTQALQSHHFIVHACDMSEFIKAGGACKCLTLQF